MAFAITAVETMADAFGMPRSSVGRAVRALREHDTALWPEGRPGKGNGAHVEAEHLTHALLAIGVPTREPLTEAHTWTVQYANFVPVAERKSSPAAVGGAVASVERIVKAWGREDRGGVLEANALRDALAWVIRATSSADPKMRERMRRTAPHVVITSAPYPMVSIISTSLDDGVTTFSTDFAEPQQGEFFPEANTALLTRQTCIPFAAFEVLGTLCADTEARRKPTPCLPLSEPATSSAGPETENAGPLPEGPAPNLDHDRNSKAGDPVPFAGQSEANGRERQSQAPSRGPGRSLNRHRRPHHGRAADSPSPAAA